MTRIFFAVSLAVLILACTSAPPAPSGNPTTTPTPTPAPTATSSAPQSNAPATEPPSGDPSSTPAVTTSPSPTTGPTGIDAELVAPGTLTACVSDVGSPAASVTADGQFEGYNVAFANELANRMELEIAVQQPLFEDLIDEVSGHACDISVSSQNITASRSEQVSFVPYTQSVQPVLVEVGNPETIDTLESLCGLPVSATSGTTHVDLVTGVGDFVGEGLNDQCAAAGADPIDLRTYGTELEAVTALLDGEVVAYLGNPSFVFDFPDQIVYSQASLPPARQGITVALDRPATLAAVESALAGMIADGVYRGILVQYLPNEDSVRAVSIEEEG